MCASLHFDSTLSSRPGSSVNVANDFRSLMFGRFVVPRYRALNILLSIVMGAESLPTALLRSVF